MQEFFAHQSFSGESIAVALLDWRLWLVLMLAIILATTVHEFGHAFMADRLGDPGPRAAGRVTLNPIKHLDPLGTLVMAVTTLVGFPLGWGKPVKTDPDSYRTPDKRVGMAYVAMAGPLMNIVFAIALSPIVRWFLDGGRTPFVWLTLFLFALSLVTMAVNLSLFVFNLVPVHPLDGSHVVAALLPKSWVAPYVAFMKRYGTYVLLLLTVTHVLDKALAPLIIFLFRWLIGR